MKIESDIYVEFDKFMSYIRELIYRGNTPINEPKKLSSIDHTIQLAAGELLIINKNLYEKTFNTLPQEEKEKIKIKALKIANEIRSAKNEITNDLRFATYIFHFECNKNNINYKPIKITTKDIYSLLIEGYEFFVYKKNEKEINKFLLKKFVKSLEEIIIGENELILPIKIKEIRNPLFKTINKVFRYKILNKNINLEEVLEFEKFNLQNEDYFIYEKLAEGGSSKVYLAKYENVKDVENVIKIFDINDESTSALKKHLEYYGKEEYFERANRIQHELRKKGLNFVPVFHEFRKLKNGKYYTIEEHIDGNNLAEISKKLIEYKNKEEYGSELFIYLLDFWEIIKKVNINLESLHQLGFIHRDIKLENIIINEKEMKKRLQSLEPNQQKYNTYIVDWHTAEKLQLDKKYLENKIHPNYNYPKIFDKVHGSRLYTPPEKFLTGESSTKTDMYALGATMFAFLTGKPPFFEYYKDKKLEEFPNLEIVKNQKLYEKILNEEIELFKQISLFPKISKFYKREFRLLALEKEIELITDITKTMKNLLSYDPKDRIDHTTTRNIHLGIVN